MKKRENPACTIGMLHVWTAAEGCYYTSCPGAITGSALLLMSSLEKRAEYCRCPATNKFKLHYNDIEQFYTI